MGPWTWINKALAKPFDGTMDLDSHTFKCVLLGSAQVVDGSFVGASTNARYADLTAELPTASGYTAGGVALTGLSIIAPLTSSRLWSAANVSWTITAPLTFKYAAIYDDSLVNKDLLCVADFNPGSTTVVASISPLVIVTSNGILSWRV